jgi:superfamily I DNA/RNA helicase
LYRTNRQAEALVEAFKKSSIPFHVVGPLGPGLQKFLEHLRTCVPVGAPPEPGATLTGLIKKEARAQGLEEGLLEFLLLRAGGHSVPGGPSRPGGRETLDAFIDEMVLSAPSDNYDIKADKVNLMTLHMSKGLEFEVVFITGAEDGLVPLRLKGRDTDTEEERRLFYVGITRARKTLYLLHAAKRRTFGEPIEAGRSPFLAEIPADLMDVQSVKKRKKTRRPVQEGLFE